MLRFLREYKVDDEIDRSNEVEVNDWAPNLGLRKKSALLRRSKGVFVHLFFKRFRCEMELEILESSRLP